MVLMRCSYFLFVGLNVHQAYRVGVLMMMMMMMMMMVMMVTTTMVMVVITNSKWEEG